MDFAKVSFHLYLNSFVLSDGWTLPSHKCKSSTPSKTIDVICVFEIQLLAFSFVSLLSSGLPPRTLMIPGWTCKLSFLTSFFLAPVCNYATFCLSSWNVCPCLLSSLLVFRPSDSAAAASSSPDPSDPAATSSSNP